MGDGMDDHVCDTRVYFTDVLGRRRPRGYKRKHNEFRKIVPKRRFNKRTAAGLIKFHAYSMDITHAQLAAAAKVGVSHVNNMLSGKPWALKPHYITTFATALALTKEQTEEIFRLAAKEAGYLIGDM